MEKAPGKEGPPPCSSPFLPSPGASPDALILSNVRSLYDSCTLISSISNSAPPRMRSSLSPFIAHVRPFIARVRSCASCCTALGIESYITALIGCLVVELQCRMLAEVPVERKAT